jgi:hypothetical protein
MHIKPFGTVIGIRWVIYFLTLKSEIMLRSILYVVAVVLVIGWALGLFVYNVGAIIHILLILAVISIIISFLGGSKSSN